MGEKWERCIDRTMQKRILNSAVIRDEWREENENMFQEHTMYNNCMMAINVE